MNAIFSSIALTICNVALIVSFLLGIRVGRWFEQRGRGHPGHDDVALSYLVYISTSKDLAALDDREPLDSFIKESWGIREQLLKGMKNPTTGDFFLKWMNFVPERKRNPLDCPPLP